MNINQTVNISQSKSIDFQMGHKDDFIEQLSMRSSNIPHKRYGNMKILLQTDRILITLGPDYLCFLVTFIFFLVAGCLLFSFVNSAFEQTWLKVLNALFLLTQLFSYLAVALSNPGIVLQENLPSQQTSEGETETTKRYCLKCKIRMSKNMSHCKRCDVCIRNYDHHCPWVSKCVGGSNLKRFYFFVSITPIYIVYYMIMLMLSLAMNAATSTPKS